MLIYLSYLCNKTDVVMSGNKLFIPEIMSGDDC